MMTDMDNLYIITGNALSSGDVVYWAGPGDFSRQISKAQRFTTRPEADTACAEAQTLAHLITGLYVIPVRLDADRLAPQSLKEIIRSEGPTIPFQEASHV